MYRGGDGAGIGLESTGCSPKPKSAFPITVSTPVTGSIRTRWAGQQKVFPNSVKALPVKHPDYCLITPGDYVVYVFQTEHQRNVVAVRNITRIEHNVTEAARGEE